MHCNVRQRLYAFDRMLRNLSLRSFVFATICLNGVVMNFLFLKFFNYGIYYNTKLKTSPHLSKTEHLN